MELPVDPARPTGSVYESKSFASAGEWFTPARFALFLAVFIFALYPDVLVSGKSFVFRDFGAQVYPNAFYQRECFWRGELPLWNPLDGCGIPFLAQWNMLCLYPLALIYLVLPLTWGLMMFMMFHLFWAGFGMYLLAARWTRNRLAAAVAGVAFAFNGMTINSLMWSSVMATLAWMPFVVLLVEQAWLLGGARRICAAALVGAVQMLAGTPEVIACTWFILFVLWVGRFIREKRISAGIFLRAGVIAGLTGLLCAAQLLPFLGLLAHSERSNAYGTDHWAIPLSGWANLFVPLFHCDRSPLGVYYQPAQAFTSSYYPGIATLALAVVAIVTVRNLRVWLLAAIALFGFGMALGEAGHFYAWVAKVFPFLGFMRFPVKYIFLTTFTVPLLAAWAIAQFQGGAAKPDSRLEKHFLATALIFCAIICGILGHARVQPLPFEHWPVLCLNGVGRVAFLGLIVGGLFLYVRAREEKKQILLAVLLVAFFWLDAATHVPRQNPTVEPSVFEPGLVASRMPQAPRLGEGRALATTSVNSLVYTRMLPNPAEDYFGRRCALMGDCNILDDIPTGDQFYSLCIREQRSVFVQLLTAPTNNFPDGLADFLGCSQMTDPEYLMVWQSRPTPMRLCSIGQKPEFAAPSNAVALMLSTNFDPRKVVYLPLEARSQLNVTSAVPGVVRSTRFVTPQNLEVEVEASAPALLVLSQTYYDPWQAIVNGQPVRIWRANGAFQAIEVPPGPSRVKLVYRDKFFNCGVGISVLTLAGCMLGLWKGSRRQAQHPLTEPRLEL